MAGLLGRFCAERRNSELVGVGRARLASDIGALAVLRAKWRTKCSQSGADCEAPSYWSNAKSERPAVFTSSFIRVREVYQFDVSTVRL
jgi:hypothetical protein